MNAHLNFNGECEAAFRFYEKYLGGKIAFLMKYRDSPLSGQTPPELGDKIVHATFILGDDRLTGADTPPEDYRKPQGFSVVLNVAEAAEADRIFEILGEGGAVQMPLQETFWALRFGMLVDRFGTPWIINCGKPA